MSKTTDGQHVDTISPSIVVAKLARLDLLKEVGRTWSDIITDVGDAFDNASGIFSAQSSGDFEFHLALNYQTSMSFDVNPDMTDVPSVELFDVLSGNKIVTSTLPATTFTFQVPASPDPVDVTVSNLLVKAQSVISVIASLTEGQTVGVRVNSNGLTYGPLAPAPVPSPRILFAPEGLDTVLTIKKLRNSPTVVISCNN